MEPMNSVTGNAPVSSRKLTALWIAIAVVVLAAAWYYYAYYSLPAAPSGPDEATTRLEIQGTSDELGAIEQDLNATDFGGLNQELPALDQELQGL